MPPFRFICKKKKQLEKIENFLKERQGQPIKGEKEEKYKIPEWY